MLEKNYYSYVFMCKELNIQIEAEGKIQAIEKFSHEYKYLFNQQWTVLEINRTIKIDGTEEKYL